MKIILTKKGVEKFGTVSAAYWGGWDDLGLISEGYARQDPFDPPPATAEGWHQLACDLVKAARRAGVILTLEVDRAQQDAAQAAYAGADTERLDWLENSGHAYVTHSGEWVFSDMPFGRGKESLRNAIDADRAAMSAATEQKEKP